MRNAHTVLDHAAVEAASGDPIGVEAQALPAVADPLRLTRRRIREIRAGSRRATSRWRLLPQTLIIGGQRCGTTFLYHALASHPDVAPPIAKEVGYFTLQWDRDESWYRSHFPLHLGGPPFGRRTAHNRGLTLDATPYYLFHPYAAARAATVVPDAKLLVLLRDPVERAYSHYWHSVHRGWEKLGFAEAIAAEKQRLADDLDRFADDVDDVSLSHRVYSYLARGKYAGQLARWRQHYGRDQMLVLRSEDLFADPARHYAEILTFLGLRSWHPDFAAARKVPAGLSPDPPPPMEPGIRAQLREYYRDDNTTLAQMLGWEETWPAGLVTTA